LILLAVPSLGIFFIVVEFAGIMKGAHFTSTPFWNAEGY
jgi:hypothetical protein